MKICIILTRFNKKHPFKYEEDSIETNYNYIMPIGLSYISSALKNAGNNVTFLNLNHRGGLIKDILNVELKMNKYDFVFMGSLSFYYPNIRDYIKYIREISPSTIIVIGGGLVSSQPDIMLKLLKPDFVVIGEGEETVVELVNCVRDIGNISDVNGIGYINDENEITITNPRLPIKDLDTIAFPDYDGNELNVCLDKVDPKNYLLFDKFDIPRYYPLLMSRSCPYQCTFCYHQLGPKYRQRSIDNIMEEIKLATLKYKINIFIGYDELFASDRERLIEFCEKFNTFRKTIPWEVGWNCSLRVDNIDGDLIKMMKNAGCYSIGLGLESYSDVVLKSMKKHITSDQIKNALQIISDNGMSIQGTFIFGDPAETIETAEETLKFYRDYQNIIRGSIQLGFISLFQGSPLYNYCLNKGIVKSEIDFIEDRAKNGYTFYKPLNMTSLSDKEFYKLVDKIMVTIYTVGNRVVPLKSDIPNEVHIKCPYCNKISIIKNMNVPKWFDVQNIGCRHCNGRFEMISKYYFIRSWMFKILGFHNVSKLYEISKSIKGLIK